MLVCTLLLLFFFFKQTTAYEMRISDWSSDVCSSDLIAKDDANRFVEGDAGHSARPFRDLRSEADRAVLTPVPLDDKIFSMYARGMTVRETLSYGAARLGRRHS